MQYGYRQPAQQQRVAYVTQQQQPGMAMVPVMCNPCETFVTIFEFLFFGWIAAYLAVAIVEISGTEVWGSYNYMVMDWVTAAALLLWAALAVWTARANQGCQAGPHCPHGPYPPQAYPWEWTVLMLIGWIILAAFQTVQYRDREPENPPHQQRSFETKMWLLILVASHTLLPFFERWYCWVKCKCLNPGANCCANAGGYAVVAQQQFAGTQLEVQTQQVAQATGQTAAPPATKMISVPVGATVTVA